MSVKASLQECVVHAKNRALNKELFAEIKNDNCSKELQASLTEDITIQYLNNKC